MSVEPSDQLRYLPGHKVIICTSCRYALQPSGILRHLKDVHHILRSRRKPFAEHISHYDLADVETVIRSTDSLKQFPVPGLPIFKGLLCLHKDCGYLCVTEKRMKAHWTMEHNRMGRPEFEWRPVPLQTFFRGNALRYFTASVPTSTHPVLLRHISTTRGGIANDDAALMQHYVKFVSLTLADEAPTDGGGQFRDAPISLWQQTIPELAKTSSFLNHGILACSALHLAYIDQNRRQSYVLAAARHQELAIPQFRSEIANLHPDNCNSILAFIHILTICSFASEPDDERLLIVDPLSPDIVSDWLLIMRRGCDYVHTFSEIVLEGPMQGLLCNYALQDMSEGVKSVLLERLLGIIPPSNVDGAWTDKECRVFRQAVEQLAGGFAYADLFGQRLNTWTVLRVWPMVVSIEFLTMLQHEHPGALVALAHYCVLLHRLDSKWYAAGRGQRLLSHILLRLDTKWHACIDWSIFD